jgi:hypothetical protein
MNLLLNMIKLINNRNFEKIIFFFKIKIIALSLKIKLLLILSWLNFI